MEVRMLKEGQVVRHGNFGIGIVSKVRLRSTMDSDLVSVVFGDSERRFQNTTGKLEILPYSNLLAFC